MELTGGILITEIVGVDGCLSADFTGLGGCLKSKIDEVRVGRMAVDSRLVVELKWEGGRRWDPLKPLAPGSIKCHHGSLVTNFQSRADPT